MTTAEDLAAALRSRGLRVTSQREQVLSAVRRLGHGTPEEISAEVDDVDVTTVYRTLQLLEEIGLVAHTHLGHGASSYQPADDIHIHVVCHGCGSVVAAPYGLVDALAARLLAERDFTVDLAHLTIFGQCADCTAAGTPISAHIHSQHEHSSHHEHPSTDRAADPLEQTGAVQR